MSRAARARKNDDDNVAGFKAGEPDAVRAVYRAYGDLVNGIARRVLGDRALAEEATQLAFVNAWRGAQSFDASRPLGPWLATIAHRAALDVLRYERRRPHQALEQAPAIHPALIVAAPSVERLDDLRAIRAAVAALPVRERSVVRLQHYHQLTHAEIADVLGVPVGTVKSRSHSAHRRLAAAVGYLRDSASDANPATSSSTVTTGTTS